MSEIIDSYKKVFENKKAHIWLLLTAFLWTVMSTSFDIKFGNGSAKDNPIDLFFGFLIGLYSLQFLHNAIHNINNSVLPSIKEFNKNIIWGMIKLNVVWAIYAIIVILLAILSYVYTHVIVLPIIIICTLFILSAGVYYIFLAFADNFCSKNLWKLPYIFKFIKSAYKPLYINICLFILLTIGAIAIYIVIFLIASLIGIDEILPIADNLYAMDIIMNTIASYLVIITWYFAFPYSLISSYKELIRPMLKTSQQPICEKGEE